MELDVQNPSNRLSPGMYPEVQWPVRVQTKSVLALRDLDLFRQFRDLEVAFTIATDDEKMARLFEPGASSIAERIDAAAGDVFRHRPVLGKADWALMTARALRM